MTSYNITVGKLKSKHGINIAYNEVKNINTLFQTVYREGLNLRPLLKVGIICPCKIEYEWKRIFMRTGDIP